MSRDARAGRRWRTRWPAALTLAATLAPASVRADLWSLDSTVETRFESNDNTSLSPISAGTVNTLSLSTSLAAARRVENAATRLNVDLAALHPVGRGARDRVDGRLALSQSFNDPRNSVSLAATLAQDFNSDLISADVTQGRGRRRTLGLSASWSHSLSERLSTSAQGSITRAGYGRELTQATDYRNASLSAGLSYLVSEVAGATAQASHSEYRSLSGSNRSSTDSIDAGLSRTFSERLSASFNLGAYRTITSALGARLACPLQVSFCEAGLVPFIVVVESVTSSRTGLQFSSSARYQVDEITALSFSASRQQSPSGAGAVVRSDALSLNANHSFSPTRSASMSYGQSRSSLQGATGSAQPGQKSLSLSLSQQLAPNLSLQTSYRHSAADNLAGGQRARSNSVNVALKYDWAKLEVSR